MKTFDEVYNGISKETFETLEVLRKKDNKSDKLSVLLVIFFVLASILNFSYRKHIVLGEVIIFFIVYKLSQKISKSEFSDEYKEKIIKPIVESYDDEMTYCTQGKITEDEYAGMGFRTSDKFYSNDSFETKDEKIRASVVTVVDISNNDEGHEERRVIFDGVCAIFTLDNFSEEVISLKIDSKVRNFLNNAEKIEVDSAEFERDFDLYCKNRTYAMEIFTSDFLDLLSKISKENNTTYDFIIKENKLCVRYHKTSVFDVSTKTGLQKESIESTYEKFYKMMNLLTSLKENIDKKLGDIKVN